MSYSERLDGNGLPSLKENTRLLRLRKMGIARIRVDSHLAPLPPEPPQEPEDLPLVYPPFQSVEEVWIWNQLQKIDPYWAPHVNLFGGIGVRGGTNVDFMNVKLRIALYADGPPHKIPSAMARDHYQRKAVEGAGYRVLSFDYTSLDDAKIRFRQWYNENV